MAGTEARPTRSTSQSTAALVLPFRVGRAAAPAYEVPGHPPATEHLYDPIGEAVRLQRFHMAGTEGRPTRSTRHSTAALGPLLPCGAGRRAGLRGSRHHPAPDHLDDPIRRSSAAGEVPYGRHGAPLQTEQQHPLRPAMEMFHVKHLGLGAATSTLRPQRDHVRGES